MRKTQINRGKIVQTQNAKSLKKGTQKDQLLIEQEKGEKRGKKKKKKRTLGLMESRVTGREEEESEADISEEEEDKWRDEESEGAEKGGRRERKLRFL